MTFPPLHVLNGAKKRSEAKGKTRVGMRGGKVSHYDLKGIPVEALHHPL